MGTDIHLYFERINEDEKWEKVEVSDFLVPDDRDYDLFEFLRNSFSGRGWPKNSSIHDIKPEDDSHWYGDWGFTHAYMDEIIKAPWHTNMNPVSVKSQEPYFKIFFDHVLPRILNSTQYKNWDDPFNQRNVRVIIGFDS